MTRTPVRIVVAVALLVAGWSIGPALVLASAARAAVPVAVDDKPEKLKFEWGGATRTYYLLVPEKARAGSAPLLFLLHGSGRDGKSLIDPWQSLAKSEGIILVAPDASNPQGWRIPEEGPQFFHDLLEKLRASDVEIDDRRMYVFGHSAGAIHGLDLGLLESEYFAAVAAHAGVVSPEMVDMMKRAPRKIPMAIWIGTNDASFPLNLVRNTRDLLNANGFNTQLAEIPNHTHDYYGSASSINKQTWAFLSRQRLEAAPKFQHYEITR